MCGVVSGDVRTTTGRNIWYLKQQSGLDPLNCGSSNMKTVLSNNLVCIPDLDRWRVRYLARLLEERGQAHYENEK